MRNVFWFGRSSCRYVDGIPTLCDISTEGMENPDIHTIGVNEQWITEEGWYEKLRQYVNSQTIVETAATEKELMWLFIPDFLNNGKMSSINVIPKRGKTVPKNIWEMKEDDIYWRAYPGCSDFIISDKGCDLRTKEMEIVAYTPYVCETNDKKNCD